MKSNSLIVELEKRDEIFIFKDCYARGLHSLKLGHVTIQDVNNKQLLDLGMKIQSVVNAIDRESREALNPEQTERERTQPK